MPDDVGGVTPIRPVRPVVELMLLQENPLQGGDMVPAEVYERTFQLWAGGASATCFAADIDGRQYVVTARHVVEHGDPRDLRITRNGSHEPLGATRPWLSPRADIAVISLDRLLAPADLTLPLTKDAMVYGQDAYFLGFPYGMTWTPRQLLHQGQPIPLVKKAIVSGEIELGPDHDVLLLDGHNNEGFSGGPVVLVPPGRTKVQVVGVVMGYRVMPVPVSDPTGLTIGAVLTNTGLMFAENITEALVGARALGDGCPV